MKLLVFLMLLSSIVFASETETFRFGYRTVEMIKKGDILVNKGCELPECLAIKKAKEHWNTPLNDEWMHGGKNPFSVRCRMLMKGTVMIGVDKKGNELAFCRFEDQSYLRLF